MKFSALERPGVGLVAAGEPGVEAAADRAVGDVDDVPGGTEDHALAAGVGAAALGDDARDGAVRWKRSREPPRSVRNPSGAPRSWPWPACAPPCSGTLARSSFLISCGQWACWASLLPHVSLIFPGFAFHTAIFALARWPASPSSPVRTRIGVGHGHHEDLAVAGHVAGPCHSRSMMRRHDPGDHAHRREQPRWTAMRLGIQAALRSPSWAIASSSPAREAPCERRSAGSTLPLARGPWHLAGREGRPCRLRPGPSWSAFILFMRIATAMISFMIRNSVDYAPTGLP